jgi:hypothetical protein
MVLLSTQSIAATIAVQFIDELQHVVFTPLSDVINTTVGIGLFASRPGREYMQRALPSILAAATQNDNDWFGDTLDDIIP